MYRRVTVGIRMKTSAAVEIPSDVRMRVNETGQHGAAAKVYEAASRCGVTNRRDGKDLSLCDDNIDVSTASAAPVDER